MWGQKIARYGICTYLLLVCSATTLWANEKNTGIDEALKTKILASLRAARPDLSYSSVQPSLLEDFSIVQVEGGPALYVHKEGDFFFDGDLYQIANGRFVNIKEESLKGKRKRLLEATPLNEMIVFSPSAKTQGILNVFTDVDCSYCRKLHQEVPMLNAMGIEVRYLAFPRAGINSESYNKIASAWCAKDSKVALTALKNGEKIEQNVCADNPVEKQYELGLQMGVKGTPAIVLADGSLIPGYRPAADLAKILGISP